MRKHFHGTLTEAPWTTLLSRDAELADIYSLLATVIGAHNRHTKPRVVVTSNSTEMDSRPKDWVALLQHMIQADCFENVNSEERLQMWKVVETLRALALAHPEHYAVTPTHVQRVVKAPLTQKDVEHLIQQPMTPKERCVVLLLCTLGLRIGALSKVTTNKVFDVNGNVLDEWRIKEKRCKLRECGPSEVMKAALYAYKPELAHSQSPLLFPPFRNPMQPSLAST
jgi:integrase